MATKMFNPKIEIINHFDELIHQVDIDIEEALKKYNQKRVLKNLKCFKIENRRQNLYFNIAYLTKFKSSTNDDKQQTVELWPESTKLVDYLNQVRMRTIEELRKAQEEALENYKLNSARIKSLEEMSENKLEELKSQLFGEKFYFQVRIKRENKPWVFNLFTFVTDFYMSPYDIDFLEMYIEKDRDEVERFFRHHKPVLDEKMVLILILEEYFFKNLTAKKYPNHVICVTKRDILNIKEIDLRESMRVVKLNCSSIDLSKLESLRLVHNYEEMDLDGLLALQSLQLSIDSVKILSMRNLPSLKYLELYAKNVNKSLSTQLFGNLSSIRELEIKSEVFSDINLDDLVNLGNLSISGKIDDEFNVKLFKIICNHLQELSISLYNISSEQIAELFYGYNFPYLVKLEIKFCAKITKLEKKMFEGFPMLQSLSITSNLELRKIDNDAFSSLTNLVHLNLSWNRIMSINQNHFSKLINLQTLDLTGNQMELIEGNAFSNLKNLVNLDLCINRLTLNPQLFIGLINLKYLDLSYNILTYFDISFFDYISNINQINLSANYICNLDEISTFIKSVNEGRKEKIILRD